MRLGALLIALLPAATVLAEEPVSATPVVAAESLAVIPATSVPGDRKFTPFYQFKFGELGAFPNIGGFFFGNTLASALGGRYALTDTQALMGAYSLTYFGPGIRPAEGREFRERSLDHQVTLGDEWRISDGLKLGSRAQWLNEFRRSGANEEFGNGLYDFWTLGATERLDITSLDNLPIGAELTYAYVAFPNYTDLLAEFQSSGLNSELAGGANDYHRIRIAGDLGFAERGKFNASLSMLNFINAKVVTAAGITGDEAQRDLIVDAGASWSQPLVPGPNGAGLFVEPSAGVVIKRSNQNFLHFRYLGDTLPTFIARNYDYVEPSVGLPVRWTFTGGRTLFFRPSWAEYLYDARPPRDADGNYRFGETQTNTTWVFSLGYATPFRTFATWTIAWTAQVQQSNNRFEKYLPYNYTAHILQTSIEITY